jgi:ArsR family transcriptional regulator
MHARIFVAGDIFGKADTLLNRRNELVTLERAFRALADTTRLRIAHLLSDREVCVCHVHQALGLSQPKVSRHLAYLRRAGFVVARRQGKWMYYSLSADGVHPAIRQILKTTAESLKLTSVCCGDTRRLDSAKQCDASPAPGRKRA